MNDPRPPRHPVVPRPAATAIVLREHASEVQVLMARRHESLAFMGGMWVFPGGALASADSSDAAQALLPNPDRCVFDLKDLTGQPLPQRTCVALAIAACRETFEETGVLIARSVDGQRVSSSQLAQLHAARAELAHDPDLFVATLAREALRLDVDRLIYWAHWITPAGVSRRFDTRFFVARAPEGDTHIADTFETTECAWMSPDALLAKAAQGAMTIAQPTRYTLEDLRASLARHGTLDAMFSAEAERRVAPIMPKLLQEPTGTTIIMPWDPAYEATPGEGLTSSVPFEPALLKLPSKLSRDH